MSDTKLYILTGFLGSGKTTVLSSLLSELKGKKIGIIENEFGKLSVDGDILRDENIDMVEITKGSVFCTCLQLNFVKTLASMADKGLDYLFVESSGLADPSNLEEILTAAELLSKESYDFKGTICTVDSLNFYEESEDSEACQRQLKHCNLCLITKDDLISKEEKEKLIESIRKINPVCLIYFCTNGKCNEDILEKDLTKYKWAECEDTTNRAELKPKTLFMLLEEEVLKEELVSFLRGIAPFAYRVKGFVNLKNDGFYQVDLVGSKIDFKPTENKSSQLVIISKTGPEIIRNIFSLWEKNVNSKMKLKN